MTQIKVHILVFTWWYWLEQNISHKVASVPVQIWARHTPKHMLEA
jgi:hypothetical protein